MRWSPLVLAVFAAGCNHKEPAAESSRTTSSPAVGSQAAQRDPTAAFWTWFAEHAAELAGDSNIEHAMEQINQHLEPTHQGIFAEVGVDGARRTLVITADGKVE